MPSSIASMQMDDDVGSPASQLSGNGTTTGRTTGLAQNTSLDDISLERSDSTAQQVPLDTLSAQLDGALGNISQSCLEDSSQLATTPMNGNLSNATRSPKSYDIIYKVTCVDQRDKNVKIDRYDNKSFEGFNKEGEPSRQDLAIMDVIRAVVGTFPEGKPKRLNQSRKYLGTNKLEDNDRPFVLGVDFIVRASNPTAIRIFSKRVLDVLEREVKYYPGLVIPPHEFCINQPYKAL